MKNEITVGLLWHNYPSENLGVGALSHAHINLLDELAKRAGVTVRYFIVGMMPPESNRFSEITRNDVEYFHYSIKSFARHPGRILKLVRSLAKCGICFDLSEGDSFTDIYGKKRFLQQASSKLLALISMPSLVLSPQTIGPFNTRWGRSVSQLILRRAKAVFARDEQSYDYLLANGHESNSRVTTDLAFALPFERTLFAFAQDRVHVGINVSGLLLNGGYGANNQFGLSIDYRSLIEALMAYFTSLDDVQVHLVPHVISDRYEIEDDYRASAELASRFRNCVLAPKFDSPFDAKSYIAGLDFFTGARMHATIAAVSSGVPVIPIAYSRKFNGLFGSLGYQHLVDAKSATTESALQSVIEGFSARSDLKRKSLAASELARERLLIYSTAAEELIRNA